MKYIDAEKLKELLDEKYKEFTEKAKKDCPLQYQYMADGLDIAEQFIDSLQQEQPEAIVGVVHHALGTHWIVTNQKQLGARLKQFPEGAEVEILIEAKKEESNENTKNIQAYW